MSSFASIMDDSEEDNVEVEDAEVVHVEAHMQDESLKVNCMRMQGACCTHHCPMQDKHPRSHSAPGTCSLS